VAGGAILKPFPMPVLEASYKAANEVYADYAAKSPLFKKALDSTNAYRAEQLPWWQIAEYSFDTLMLSLRAKG
jgi:TRAP-type mannitol/chloroaromatic compound transport system substrate-binding protein